MADTYTLISSVTVGAGGASSIDFTSIPATYTDLCLVTTLRSSSAANVVDGNLTFNSSSSNFSWKELFGTGSSALSGGNTVNNALGQIAAANLTSSTFSSGQLYIPNYAGSTNKSFSFDFVTENNATLGYAGLIAGLWSNTSAITSIGITPSAGTWVQYSTAYLYGIKNS
jgi:hypothetical protein